MDWTSLFVAFLPTRKVKRKKYEVMTTFVDSFHLKESEQSHKYLQSRKDAQYFRYCRLSSCTSFFSDIHLVSDLPHLEYTEQHFKENTVFRMDIGNLFWDEHLTVDTACAKGSVQQMRLRDMKHCYPSRKWGTSTVWRTGAFQLCNSSSHWFL